MRVFWYNGALMIDLRANGKPVTHGTGWKHKVWKTFGMQNRIPSGETSSGEEFFDRLVANHETVPRSTSDSHHKKHVVAINKLL